MSENFGIFLVWGRFLCLFEPGAGEAPAAQDLERGTHMHRNICKGAIGLMISAGTASAGVTLMLDSYDSVPNGNMLGAGSLSSIVFSNPYNQGSDFTLDTTLNTGADIGALVFNSGIGVEQLGTLSYTQGGVGLDFDAAGQGVQGFEIDFAAVDLDFVSEITLFTYDAMGNEVGNARLSVLVNAGVNLTASWSLADFMVSGDFDASNIDEVQVEFNIRNNPTASLDFIATEFRAVVPSNGPLALLGLGAFMIVRRSRD